MKKIKAVLAFLIIGFILVSLGIINGIWIIPFYAICILMGLAW